MHVCFGGYKGSRTGGKTEQRMKNKRYELLDSIRGVALLNMIIYHGIWDLVYLFGFDWKWYRSEGAYIWQQGICWVFIFLSGFCWALGKQQLKRGIQVCFAGILISIATLLFMPENRVMFGILTMLGSCMLLWVPLDKILKKIMPGAGAIGSMFLFLAVKNINMGYIGFEGWIFLKLPESWYQNLVTAYLGFPSGAFQSTDYFSLFPWVFLFGAGYFLYRYVEEKNMLKLLEKERLPLAKVLGRHSLWIYMIHQPALFLCFSLIF